MASLEEMAAGAEALNPTNQGFQNVAKLLKLREDFLVELFADPNDRSFVVKAHAFLVSVICTLLSLHLRKPAGRKSRNARQDRNDEGARHHHKRGMVGRKSRYG